MSDTSGRVSFGPTGQKIRRGIKTVLVRGYDDVPRSGGRIVPGKTNDAAKIHFVTENVWKPLFTVGLLTEAWINSELVELLKGLAFFIQSANNSQIDGVTKIFGVKAETAFGWLQRKIREKAAVEQPTDFFGPANRAFQVGSNRWAEDLLGKKDPTKFKVGDLVEVINRQPDKALVLSPDLILREYGHRLIQSAVGEGKTLHAFAVMSERGFDRQHDVFMKAHHNASEWTKGSLPKTLAAYLQELLRVP